MNSRSGFCPGCGAQVYPEEAHCPFCGQRLHADYLKAFLMGLGGAVVALACGGVLWWALSGPAGTPPDGPQVASAPAADAVPAPAEATPPAEPANSGKDQQAFVPPPGVRPMEPVVSGPSAFAPTGPTGSLQSPSAAADEALPLPTVAHPPPAPAADADTRKAFAKAKQESFAQHGLDLTVTASGEDATILTIKFNFPARNAAELIVAGPFPRQCEQRGFRQILFVDPSGLTWAYDMDSQELTQR